MEGPNDEALDVKVERITRKQKSPLKGRDRGRWTKELDRKAKEDKNDLAKKSRWGCEKEKKNPAVDTHQVSRESGRRRIKNSKIEHKELMKRKTHKLLAD